MKVGYARVSTKEQNLSLQEDALLKAGCEIIFKEKVSAVKERKELQAMLAQVRKGDVIVIWKLDRLARSLKDLVDMVSTLQERGIGLISLNDPVDTTSSHGRLVFGIFASLAEFEREIIRERTIAGLEAARARGRNGGRPKGLSKDAYIKVSAAADLYKKRTPVDKISKTLGISKATLYKYLRIEGLVK